MDEPRQSIASEKKEDIEVTDSTCVFQKLPKDVKYVNTTLPYWIVKLNGINFKPSHYQFCRQFMIFLKPALRLQPLHWIWVRLRAFFIYQGTRALSCTANSFKRPTRSKPPTANRTPKKKRASGTSCAKGEKESYSHISRHVHNDNNNWFIQVGSVPSAGPTTNVYMLIVNWSRSSISLDHLNVSEESSK